ncbi:putative cytokinetic ring protein SteA [Natronospora cellulosivora (SeqCode)]
MIKGIIVIDKKTKKLIERIKYNEIAIIDHKDIDSLASKSLIEKRVKAVFNISSSISGKYSNDGPMELLDAGIPLIDVDIGDLFSELEDGDSIVFDNKYIYKKKKKIASAHKVSKSEIKEKLEEAINNQEKELLKFIDNTLLYARKEKKLIIDLEAPDIGIDFKGKHVLIVVRGTNYKDDLEAINSYVREVNPIIIAVDGGADACIECGYFPDIIVGDMDSVSDKALKLCKLLIIHAYPDGEAPGLNRVKKLSSNYIIYPAPGTSEDIAMIIAYDKGAELIAAVGTHSNMIDFLEKGRPGMASTFLVRLKLGHKLIDAKGISKLYNNKVTPRYSFQFFLAILLPLVFFAILSPPFKQILQLLALRIRLILN